MARGLMSGATLSNRLNAVRCAIGDSGCEQRLIRTFRGKGLRFIGAAREEPKAVNAAPRSAAEAGHRAWMLQERTGACGSLRLSPVLPVGLT
jgi:DNA-binding winged helix-turn-helix (wHTH) protein